MKRLREGQGVVDAWPSTALLLEGLQEGVEGMEAGGLAEDEGNVIDDWEMVAVVEEFVLRLSSFLLTYVFFCGCLLLL